MGIDPLGEFYCESWSDKIALNFRVSTLNALKRVLKGTKIVKRSNLSSTNTVQKGFNF